MVQVIRRCTEIADTQDSSIDITSFIKLTLSQQSATGLITDNNTPSYRLEKESSTPKKCLENQRTFIINMYKVVTWMKGKKQD